jgi:cytochrome c-type biogenesis protein CcmE
MMIRGPIVSGVIVVLSVVAVVLAFANGSSQYVTMAQARTMTDDHLHLAGDLLKDSISPDIARHALRFKLKDQDGTIVNVFYKGEAPANMTEATKVVAIGHVEGDVFTSDKLLVKCPSKYEAEPKSTTSYAPTS